MTLSEPAALRLATTWIPAEGGKPMAYRLTLTNRGKRGIADFRLCVSGPGRIDPRAAVENGTLESRISNHAEFAPPPGFVLEAGRSWTVTAGGLSNPLRHWSDGSTAAYVAFADGSTAPVAIEPIVSAVDNTPLKRGTKIFPVPAFAPASVSVIPWPAEIAIEGRMPTPPGFDLQPEGEAAAAAAATFAELCETLFPTDTIVRPGAEGGFAVTLSADAALPEEGYRLDFAPTSIAVHAATTTGFLYGLVTLGQMLRGAKRHPGIFLVPQGGTIADAPATGWRGTHLDVSRQFYATGEIKAFLRILAWNKMNRFHWHLCDDEAWRIEIDAFPALTEIAAWRGHGLKLPPLLGSGPQPTGGYYTKAAVREIVAYAASLGIEIVPEIDIPGHCYAFLQAVPELRDPGEHGEYASVQGFPNNCLNPAMPATYDALGTIFDELVELFPARIIHIGADEVPLGAWSGSPLALKRLEEIAGAETAAAHARRLNVVTNHHGADDIDGSGAAILQAKFLERIQKMLAERGCVTGGWEEAAHGDVIDKAKSYLVGWRNVAISAALAGKGYDIVVAPGQAYYLDMSNGIEWSEPGASWAGWSSPEKTYAFDPVAGWTDEQKRHFIGVQACIWSEPMTDRAIFDRLVFPRLSAIAETGWTRPERKSWERFRDASSLMPILYGWIDMTSGEDA